LVEDGAQGARQLVGWRNQGRPLGSEDPQIERRAEEGDLQAVAGRGVAVGLWDPMNHAFEAKPPQVIRHLGGRVRVAEERFDVGAQVAVSEALRQMREGGDCLKERHHARVAEAQGGGALPRVDGRPLESIERVLGQDALVADPLDLQEFAIDLVAEIAQVRQIDTALAT
jgi:hypothetical protein